MQFILQQDNFWKSLRNFKIMSFQFKIRRDALLGLAQLYKSVTLNEESTQAQIDKINFVKDKVFHAYYNTNAEDK